MDLSAVLSTFGLIFVAELGDKTQLTAMALATRYPWKKIFGGIALAFLLLNIVAVVVGKILFTLLPLMWIQILSGGLFLVFGVMTLLDKGEDDEGEGERSAKSPFITSFMMILLAELGDKTQIMTASLAASQPSQLGVLIGSTLALWAVSLIGIFVGKRLFSLLPMAWVHKGAGVLFVIFGLFAVSRVFA